MATSVGDVKVELGSGKKFEDEHVLGAELGRGAFSTVRLATRKSDGAKSAVKVVTRKNLVVGDLEGMRSEAELLKRLDHPNIVKLHGWYEEEDALYMALELCEGGELFDRIVKKTIYNEKEARDLVRVLLSAIKYCHDNGIVHRDLKPENLLMVSESDDLTVKLADFGFAKPTTDAAALRTQCGTPGYVAPEILRSVPYGTPVDMWSVGVITYILLGGYPPFHDDNQARLFQKIKKGRYAFHDQYWEKISDGAKDLIRKLLTVSPGDRITAEAALGHPWVMGEGAELATHDLAENLERMRLFNARRKFKSAIHSVMMTQRFHSWMSQRDINEVYELGVELGRGAYSVVKAGKDKTSGEEVAVKVIKRTGLKGEDEAALRGEIKIMMELDHAHIIKLLDFFEQKQHYYMVVEKVNGGELFDRIVSKVVYNEKEARDLVRLLLQAIQYCHSKGVVHRDLKPENLLLVSPDDDATVKIADFGFAHKYSAHEALTTQCGTPGYVAPEILTRRPYNEAVDIWSVGVITYILLGGYPPFHDEDQARLFMKIKKGAFKFHDEYWKDISDEAKDLIRKMLTVDPMQRITAKEALHHPYLKVKDEQLAKNDMSVNLTRLRLFNARRKFKSAIQTVILTQRLSSLVA